MSIIHEALKKAERERDPRPRAVHGPYLAPDRGRRHRGVGLARLMLGAMIGCCIGAAIWLELGGILPLDSAPQPGPSEIIQSGEVQMQGHPPAPNAPVVARQEGASAVSVAPAVPTGGSPFVPSATAAARAGAEAIFERAVSAEAEGRWDEAVLYYRQALEQDPGLLKARNNLGNLYIRQNRLAEAVGQFQAALTLAPAYAYARNNLGSAYLMMGQETEAIQEFLAALRLDGSYVSPYYNLAAIYARRRDLPHVVAFLTKAIALEPAVLSWISADADFDAIRTAPAFRHLGMPNHARR
jgi:tetratricopeptide (TPR) repeat protein